MIIPEKNNNKKIILISAIAVLIILALIGFAWMNKKSQKGESGSGNTPGAANAPVPVEAVSISGTVEKIEGKTLIVKSLAFGEQKEYSVIVDSSTKIQTQETKKDASKAESGKPFDPYVISDVSFSDIRLNDNVAIEASQDIRNKTSFVATKILIAIVSSSNEPDSAGPTSVPPPAPTSSSPTSIPSVQSVPPPAPGSASGKSVKLPDPSSVPPPAP